MKKIIIIGMIFIISGCASTAHNGFYDESAFTGVYDKILVIAIWKDLGEREIFENSLCKYIAQSTPCSTLISLVPPTRELDRDGLIKAIETSGADALVSVKLDGVEKKPILIGTDVYISTTRIFETKVLDVKAGQYSYISTSKTNNDMGAVSFEGVVKSYAVSLLEDLRKKSLIGAVR